VRRAPWDFIGVVALGGMIGASARFGIGLAWSRPPGFPWPTFVINASGCALIGALTVLVSRLSYRHRLVRAFAGTGLLGGYTTFSAYAVDVDRLLRSRAAGVAVLYLVATPAAALVSVAIGAGLAGLALRGRPRARGKELAGDGRDRR
jgi:CrcB protein